MAPEKLHQCNISNIQYWFTDAKGRLNTDLALVTYNMRVEKFL